MPSGVDPNIYALNVQLSLEAGEAFSTLDKFGESVSRIEDQVSSAAQIALKSIDDVASGLDKSLGNVTASTKTIETTAGYIESKFVQVMNSISDINDLSDEELKIYKEFNELLEEQLDFEEKIQKVQEKELETRDDSLISNDNIVKSIKKKNKLHDDELKLVLDENTVLGKMQQQWGEINQRINTSVKYVSFLAKKFKDVMDTIAKATEIQEKFVENNYRAYGSMEGIAQQTRQLSTQQGVLEEKAVAAYKALADVRTPREEIGKYAKQIVMMNRVTGVSIDTLAEYSRRMRLAGGDAGSSELAFGRAQEAMRKFGVSAAAMNKILGDTTVTTTDLTLMFGEMGQADFTTLQVQLAGLAESVGISGDKAREQLNFLANDLIAGFRMAEHAGMDAIHSIADMEEAMIGAGAAYKEQYDIIENSTAAPAEKKLEMEMIAKSMGFVDSEAARLGMELARLREEMGQESSFDEIMAKAAKNLEESWTATQRFNHALKDLYDNVGLVFSNFLSLIGVVLVPMIKWLARFAAGIAWVIGKLGQLYDWARQLFIIGDIIWLLEEAVGFVMALAVAIGFLIVAFAGFSNVGALVAKTWGGAGKAVASIGKQMKTIAASVGQAVVTLFTSIGKALAALGNAIRPQMVPLLALGAALLMAGLGAYFFAKGVMAMASLPIGEMAVRLFILVAAMLALALGIALISTIVGPAIWVIYALGGALLLIGAAAWLMGAGLKMAAEAFVLVIDAISAALSALSAEAIDEFASGLLSASWKIALAAVALIPAVLLVVAVAPLILSAGIVLLAAGALFALASMAIGYGAQLLGQGFTLLGKGAKAFVDVDFIGIAYQLLVGGLLLFAAGSAFILGATAVGIGAMILGYGLGLLGPGAATLSDVDFIGMAGQLLAGGLLLAAAGSPFVLGATLVGIGAILLGYGLGLLGPGAATLADVDFIGMAYQLLVGGLLLMAAGSPFVLGASLVGIGAILLGAGLLLLGKGAKELEGIDFIAMAWQLAAGGFWLALGGATFAAAATLVGTGAMILGAGFILLGKGAQELEGIDLVKIAVDLNTAGLLLSAAAIPLILGSIALVYAAYFILIAGMLIGLIGVILENGAAGVLAGAQDLSLASGMLLYAGNVLIVAAPRLLIGAAWLLDASRYLIGASIMLMLAGYFLVPAALSIYLGLWWLASSIDRFKKSVPSIEKIGVAMFQLATAFDIMRTVPFNTLDDAAEAGLSALPKLDKFARRLPAVAERMQDATARFKKPASELAQVLNTLGDAISKFDGVGQNLADEMEAVSNTLDKYAFRLESAAQRVQLAVNSKAIPAMMAAGDAGIEETVKSEAITQVQVTSTTEGEDKGNEQTALLIAQVAILKEVDNKLGAITGDNDSPVTSILELLQSFLPQMIEKDAGLASEMNQWMK